MLSRSRAHDESQLHFIYSINQLLAEGKPSSLKKVLDVICQFTGMEYGFISKIVSDRYYVLSANLNGFNGKDTIFKLGESYCRVINKSTHAFDLSSLKFSGCEGHPCVPGSIPSYFGIPIRINNMSFGTVCLISTEEKNKKFTTETKELMAHVGVWIGSCIKRLNLLDDIRDFHEEISTAQDLSVEISTELNRVKFEHQELKQLVFNHLKPRLEDAFLTPYSGEEGSTEDIQNILDSLKGSLEFLNNLEDFRENLLYKEEENTKFSLNGLMIELAKLYKPVAKEHEINLKLELPTFDLRIQSNKGILKSIISEILKHAMLKGGRGSKLTLSLSKFGQIRLHHEFGQYILAENRFHNEAEAAGLGLLKASNLAKTLGVFLNVNNKSNSDFWVQVILPASLLVDSNQI